MKRIFFLSCFLFFINNLYSQDVSLLPQSLINPPEASQDGSANLQYPVMLPAGINNITPSLSVNYNSDGGNSWMGLGWNIGTSAVYIDTRWGVPRFDPDNESELYSLYGEQLMYPDDFLPHRHKVIETENGELYSTVPQERNSLLIVSGATSIKVFHPRRKETYAKIERIGNSPANYYWKVTNMDGSISWFGGDETGLDNAYVVKSGNNIAFWALKKRVDTHGYFIKYEYQSGTTPTGNLAGGKHLYLKKISYTGLQKLNGSILKQPSYEVVFDLDGGTRQDKSISARYGYKDVIVNRLNQIRVNETLNGTTSLVNKYVFTYGTGAFGKTVLKKIEEYKGNNVLVFSHSLDYHGLSPNDEIFAESTGTVNSIDTNMTLYLDDVLNISRLGTTENSGVGGELNVSAGAGLSWQNMSANGTFVNIPLYDLKANLTNGKVTMIDINGDGLEDVLYKDSNGHLKYLENTCTLCKKEFKLIYNPAINITYSSQPKSLVGVNHFLKGENIQKAGLVNGLFGFSMEYLFAKFGVKNYKSKSLVSHYITDANGDMLPDFVVKQGDESVVFFNHIDNGVPTFTTTSEPTPNLLIVADIINPEGDEEQEQEEEPEMKYDAVKVIALDNQMIYSMQGTISLDNPGELAGGEEIKVTIEAFDENLSSNNHIQLFSGKLTPTNSSLNINFNSNDLNSANARYIYFFRTHYYSSKNPKVNWNISTAYSTNISDGNETILTNFSLTDQFFLSNEGSFTLKLNGSANVSWGTLNLPNPLTDDLVLRVVKRTVNQNGEVIDEIDVFEQNIDYGTTSIPSGSTTFISLYNENTQTGEYTYTDVICKLISTSNVKWTEILWRPKLTYSGLLNTGGETYTVNGEKYLVPKHSIYNVEYRKEGGTYTNPYVRYKKIEPFFYSGMYTGLLFTPGNILPKFVNNNINLNSAANGTIYLMVKNNGQLIGKRIISVTNGQLSINDTSPIVLNQEGLYYIFFSTNDELDDNTPNLLKEFIDAHAGYNHAFFEITNTSLPIPNFLSTVGFSGKGSVYRGGGQFFYNPELAGSNTPVDAEGDKLIDVNALNFSSFAEAIYTILGVNPEDYETEEEYEQAILDALGLEEGEDIGIDEIDDYLNGNSTIEDLMAYLMSSQSILPATPFRKKEGNEFIDKWIGLSEDMYVDRTSARAGKFDIFNNPFADAGIGDEDPEEYGPQQADLETGMFSISQYGEGASKSSRLFIWSKSSGENKQTSKFIDLNGDRYPDIIQRNNVYLTTMTGGHKTMPPSAVITSPLELTKSSVEGKSISRSFNNSDLSKLISLLKGEGLGSPDQNNATARVGFSIDDMEGDIKQEELWLDINGDGFTDWIIKEGDSYKIHYSLGNVMDAAPVNVNLNYIPSNFSPAGSVGVNIGGGFGGILGGMTEGFNIGGMVDISIGGSFAQSNVKSQFVDINNDGMLDIVYESDSKLYVRYNMGNAFTAGQVLADISANGNFSLEEFSKDTSAAGNITVGIVFSYNFIIPIGFVPLMIYIKGGPWLMFNGNVTSSEVKKTFKDINGDGFPDLLLDREYGFQIYNSKLGQMDKLKNVWNDMGNGFTLNYIPIGNTYKMPVNKWVLNHVTDIKSNAPAHKINQFFEYRDGYYDRREREFYGFSLVKSYTGTKLLSEAHLMGETAFRATIEGETINKYYNNSYYLQGKLKEQYIIKGDYDGLFPENLPANRIHSKTENFYRLKPPAEGGLIDMDAHDLPEDYDTGGTKGLGTAAAILGKSVTKLYEYGNTPITSTIEYVYDGYKRLTSQKSIEEDRGQEFYYPDQLLTETSPPPFMQELVDDFRLNTMIKTITKEGNVVLLTQESGYGYNGDITGQLRVVEQSNAKGDNPLEIEITIDKYDDAGHVIQQSTSDGEPTSVIWGYSGRYPVVTVQGLAYDVLPEAIVNQIKSISSLTPDNEAALLAKIEELRVHSSVSGKGLVSAYTYYPNTGIRTAVSSNGLKTKYTYHPNGKLKEVIDSNGKTIQKFDYHYL